MATSVEADCLKLNQLIVLPEHQGKGVGRQCVTLAMDEARRLSRPVRLRALKVNVRAIALYKRLGFVITGETDTHVLIEWAL
jgi:ribosomal protein S18 acetylase RimI-like enzyme